MVLVVLVGTAVGVIGVGAAVAAPSAASARAYCRVEARIADLDVLGDTHPARVRTDLRHLLALTDRAARVAPFEIDADAWAAVDAQRRFNAVYAANGWRPEPTNQDPVFLALADDPTIAAAYLRLEQYQRRVCDRRDAQPYVA